MEAEFVATCAQEAEGEAARLEDASGGLDVERTNLPTQGETKSSPDREGNTEAKAEETRKRSLDAVDECSTTADGDDLRGASSATDDTNTRIRVDGLNKWFSPKQVKLRFAALGVSGIRRLKKFNNQEYAFVEFETAEQRSDGERKIAGHVWRHATLRTTLASRLDPERWAKKPCLDGSAPEVEATDADPSTAKSAVDCVAPLHQTSYEQQLQLKRDSVLRALRGLPDAMREAAKTVEKHRRSEWDLPWLAHAHLAAHEGAPCPVAPVVPSPLTEGYRNKCEFTFGMDADGRPNVGFQLGKVRSIGHVVGSPEDCPNVSPEMKAAVARVHTYLSTGSRLPVYNKMDASGFWRQILARQTFNNDDGQPPALMLLLQVQASAVDAAAASGEVDALVESLKHPPLQPAVRLSVGLQNGHGPGEMVASGDVRVLVGEDLNLEERFLGMKFRISPAAFFQVNTRAAERLCALLRSECELHADTILLDVCCGTGTIGLSMAPAVKRVIGIELCEEAVHDARANADLNQLANVEFHAARAEHAIKRVLEGLTSSELANLVAIVDPPRQGLHHDVLKTLRACAHLRRLLFVSCHVPGFVNNAIALCRPPSQSFKGEAFVPAKMIPVDLFPHTQHCELVVVLERPDLGQQSSTVPTMVPNADSSPAAA
ncbi:hypothetical protein AB1Y20_021450 [Prymnesium parvum]|uniref:Uncharacterized protein n=1 Tax=Prymnesium parvum TaxID=97485 RepID=A0AB34JM42_PRYPA